MTGVLWTGDDFLIDGRGYLSQGFNNFKLPISLKSCILRVIKVRLWDIAVAAIMASGNFMDNARLKRIHFSIMSLSISITLANDMNCSVNSEASLYPKNSM